MTPKEQSFIELRNAAIRSIKDSKTGDMMKGTKCSFIIYIESSRVYLPEIVVPITIGQIIMMDKRGKIQTHYSGKKAITASRKLILWINSFVKDPVLTQEIQTHINHSTEAFPLIVEMLEG